MIGKIPQIRPKVRASLVDLLRLNPLPPDRVYGIHRLSGLFHQYNEAGSSAGTIPLDDLSYAPQRI